MTTRVRHPSLGRPAANLVDGRWIELPGDEICARNPADDAHVVWCGTPVLGAVDDAVAGARAAARAWSAFPPERRGAVLRRFQSLVRERAAALAELLCDEVGKPLWEARAEADLLVNKVDITLDPAPELGLRRVTPFDLTLSPSRTGRCLFRPHGVMAVLGPFNFPAHLPTGHIVPALLAGNTVVFKPSDKAPATGQFLGELWSRALADEAAPPGVVHVVQGGARVAEHLVRHAGIDGVLFTGSWPVGRRIMEANLDRPGRILALEMGGNNAAVVLPDADLRTALIEVVRSAFATAGQRCTCTRRLIVHEAVADRFLRGVVRAGRALRAGDPRQDPPVFMGPLISESARTAVVEAHESFTRAGGESLLAPEVMDRAAGAPHGVERRGRAWFVRPGVVRVERFTDTDGGAGRDAGCDVEVFGPLLRASVVRSIDDAIEQANATRFGLAAAIFTRDDAAAARYLHEARAGCINVNTGTAGASSRLPFGGLGLSGNHRPAGSFALDYCAVPVAAMLEHGPPPAPPAGMTIDDAWLE